MVFNLDLSGLRHGTELVKRGFAKMQQGGVVMDVTNAEQARIAEEAGAVVTAIGGNTDYISTPQSVLAAAPGIHQQMLEQLS